MSNVNSKIMEDVDKTHEIVFAGLENFVKNGLNQADSAEDEAAASAQAYRMQMSLQVEYRSVSYYNYDSSGNGVDAQDNSSAVDAVA
jgi:hypothetical protein